MINTADYQRHTNQNVIEVTTHIGQDGHHEKNLQITNAGEGVEKREHCGGNVNYYSQNGKQYSKPSKN